MHVQIGVLRQESAQARRQGFRHGRRVAHHTHGATQTTAERGHLQVQGFQIRQHAVGMPGQCPTCIGGRGTGLGAYQQCHPHRILQGLQARTGRSQRQVGRTGRGGDRAALQHLSEQAQIERVDSVGQGFGSRHRAHPSF